jgi:hypothetical protein
MSVQTTVGDDPSQNTTCPGETAAGFPLVVTVAVSVTTVFAATLVAAAPPAVTVRVTDAVSGGAQ